MTQKLKLQLLVELISWAITAVIVVAVMFPIRQAFGAAFPFERNNIICIVLLLTYTRYMFLLKHTWLAYQFYAKMGLIVLTPVWLFFLINANYDFQFFHDNLAPDGYLALMNPKIAEAAHLQTLQYVQNEFVFFAVGSIIAVVTMFFRLIISIWRVYNTDKV
jgi:hypothetical protein